MTPEKKVSYRDLFVIFIKIGCAFGGGLGVLAILQEEFVDRLKLIDKKEFLTMYAIAKVIPGGTIGAIAVAFGHKYKGILGSIVAITALSLPGFSLTVILSMLYFVFRGTKVFDFVNVSVLPAALGLIVVAVLGLAKDVFKSKLLITFASISFISAFFLHVDPSLILIGGGVIAAFFIGHMNRRNNVTY